MRRTRTAWQHRDARHDADSALRGSVGLLAVLAGVLTLATWPLATVAAMAGAVGLAAARRLAGGATEPDGRAMTTTGAAEARPDPR